MSDPHPQSCNCLDDILLRTKPFWVEKTKNVYLSLGKAGPCTLENHIHVKALRLVFWPVLLRFFPLSGCGSWNVFFGLDYEGLFFLHGCSTRCTALLLPW